MLDLGQCDRQVKHTEHKKTHITVVLRSHPCRREPAGQRKPGFVKDLKELIKQVLMPFLASEDVKQALTKHRQKTDIDQQLR